MNVICVDVYSKSGKWMSKTHPTKARKLLKRGKAIIFRYKPFAIKINKEIIKGEKMFASYKDSIINLDKVEVIEVKENKVMFFTDSMVNRTNWKFENEEEAKKVFEELKNLIASKNFS